MATLQFFDTFAADLTKKVHNLSSDALKLYLSNAVPSASADKIKGDLAEITPGSGYAGPIALTTAYDATAGTVTVTATDDTVTASGGDVGPYQYAVLYNDTPTTPADPLIGWWDRGSAQTILDGGSLNLDFTDAAITLS